MVFNIDVLDTRQECVVLCQIDRTLIIAEDKNEHRLIQIVTVVTRDPEANRMFSSTHVFHFEHTRKELFYRSHFITIFPKQ